MIQENKSNQTVLKPECTGQVNLVVALLVEAKPIIQHFHLKQINHTPYKTYSSRNSNIWLVISGIGKDASAAATTFLAKQCLPDRNTAWLNVGIGGHRTLPVGTPVLAHKITDDATGQSWIPLLTFDPPCEKVAIKTVNQPVEGYPTCDVFEMEASGFYATSIGLSRPGRVHVLKVISDNQKKSIDRISGASVDQLIRNCLGEIEQIITSLGELAHQTDYQGNMCTVPLPENA